jgi:hypothetical protein
VPPPLPQPVRSSVFPPPLRVPPPTPVPARSSKPPAPVDASQASDLSEEVVIDEDSITFVEAVENTLSVNTMRVAIKIAFGDGVPVVVKRLETGDPVPPGTMEAMLVLTGEIAGGRFSAAPASFDYRAFEAWIRRCSIMIHLHGKRALRRLGCRV